LYAAVESKFSPTLGFNDSFSGFIDPLADDRIAITAILERDIYISI